VLITGCSQGLGLELATVFSANCWNVIAGVRNVNSVDSRLQLANIRLLSLDVQKSEDISNISQELASLPIDIIINNAGIFKEDNLEIVSTEDMLEMYCTNAIAPLLITQKLINNIILGSNKTIVVISGRMGSFDSYSGTGFYGYRASKAAANMLTKIMAHDLSDKNVKVIAIHPGWIKTKMGGKNAKICPNKSANSIFKLINNTHEIETGVFYTFEGQKLKW
jgi:NAD(P)-dependent dehydrogenase (short-subunit alcohol dehydrogenase family)